MLSASMVIFAGLTYSAENNLYESPLSVAGMRSQTYSGSEISVVNKLDNGENYKRYIVSFKSGDLLEYAYMTVPDLPKPGSGYPVIIFAHGYQIPDLYTPEGNYIPHTDALARSGYIVFKPDYRGNGKSEGSPGSAYFSPDYTIDILNAVSSIKKFNDADPHRIGIWGHSMGGNIVLRAAEISPDIKSIVIWNGVTGSIKDIIYNWQNNVSYKPTDEDVYLRYLGLSGLMAKNGPPESNNRFWNSIDPTENLNFVKVPVQLHVGLNDNQVPPSFSKYLYQKLQTLNKTVEYFEYPDAGHDIDPGFDTAMSGSVEFFDRYLK